MLQVMQFLVMMAMMIMMYDGGADYGDDDDCADEERRMPRQLQGGLAGQCTRSHYFIVNVLFLYLFFSYHPEHIESFGHVQKHYRPGI